MNRQGIPLSACWPLLRRQAPLVERLARQRLAQDPRCVEALTLLTHALLRRGRKPEAWAAAGDAMAAGPEDLRSLWALAHAAQACRPAAEALQVLERVRQAWPDSAAPHDLEARVHWGNSDYPRMATAARSGLALDPRNADLHHLLAHAQVRLGEFEPARAVVREGLRLDPEHAGLLQLLGEDQLRRGEVRMATATLLQSLRCDPERELSQQTLDRALRAHSALYRWIANLRDAVAKWSPRLQALGMLLLALVFASCLAVMKLTPPPHPWMELGGSLVAAAAVLSSSPHLLLWLHPVSRRALSRRERTLAAGLWAVSAAALIGGAVAVAAGQPAEDVATTVLVTILLAAVATHYPRLKRRQWIGIGVLALLFPAMALLQRCFHLFRH